MTSWRWGGAALGLAGALALGGCYDDGYDYGSATVGYGTGYYDSGYYGDAGYGWYDGYYYPGNGFYVYDRGGRRYQWRDRDRDHWQGRGQERGPERGRPDRGQWQDGRGDGRGFDGRANGDRRWQGRAPQSNGGQSNDGAARGFDRGWRDRGSSVMAPNPSQEQGAAQRERWRAQQQPPARVEPSANRPADTSADQPRPMRGPWAGTRTRRGE